MGISEFTRNIELGARRRRCASQYGLRLSRRLERFNYKAGNAQGSTTRPPPAAFLARRIVRAALERAETLRGSSRVIWGMIHDAAVAPAVRAAPIA
jgi:hypothetical protein